MAKAKLTFDGMTEMSAQLRGLGVSVERISEKALERAFEIVTDKARQAAAPHRKTGRMEKSLRERPEYIWKGSVLQTEVGFDIVHGGLPSIFLMYGTPRIKKDQKMWEAFFGTKTLAAVQEAEQTVFQDALFEAWGVKG